MGAHNLKPDGRAFLPVDRGEHRIALVQPHVLGPVFAPGGHAVADNTPPSFGLNVRQQRIIPVDKQNPLRIHAVLDVQLLPQNVLLGTQLLDVGDADIGHHRAVHTGHPGNLFHLPRLAHPQLDHGDLCLRRDGAHGDGHAHLAVGVARGPVDRVARAEGRGDHLPGGGLAHAARDAHQRDA